MRTRLKIPRDLISSMKADLRRPHEFAHERVGFMVAGAASIDRDEIMLMARDYAPVADSDYVLNKQVGAMIGSDAMRKGVQLAYRDRSSLFHVHMHWGRGMPAFSVVDLKSGREFVPGFSVTVGRMPHGMMVINEDAATAMIWLDPKHGGTLVDEIVFVGAPYQKTERRA